MDFDWPTGRRLGAVTRSGAPCFAAGRLAAPYGLTGEHIRFLPRGPLGFVVAEEGRVTAFFAGRSASGLCNKV